MSLFQIYYKDPENGSVLSCHVGAVDIESAIKRFRQVCRGQIVQVFERDTNLLS